jgi:hypothetical protein
MASSKADVQTARKLILNGPRTANGLPFDKHLTAGRFMRIRDIRETSQIGSLIDNRERQKTRTSPSRELFDH